MRLRTRVFLLVASAALVSGLLTYIAVDRLLASSYDTLEMNLVRAEAERGRNAVLADGTALAGAVADWANWDELHAALGGDGGKFERTYFAPLTFSGIDVSHIAVLDLAGTVRMAAGYDPLGNTLQPLPPDYAPMLAALQRALRESGRESLSSVVQTSAGIELIAIQPVRAMRDRTGSRGDVVLARRLDTRYAERLAAQLHRDVAFLPPGEWHDGVDRITVSLADERRAWGYFLLEDAAGTPVLVGRVGVSRDIHAQAQDTLGLITLVLAIIVLLAPVGAELILDRLVVSRVRGLRDWASAVAAGGKLAPPRFAHGGDEIGDLAHSIGSMATHLDGVQRDLEQAREQADRANRAKSEFLAGASHEIRTPLTAILGYAELLQDRRLNDEEYFRYLNTIRNNGEDLLGLLNDILDLSKVEAGRLDLSWEKSDIRTIVHGVITLLQVRADARGLTLRLHGDAELPALAFIDPVRFRQVLLNLVGNAIRYTDRGEVNVRCSVDRQNPVASRLRVAVQDTGVGMDAAQVARLFQPFTQLGHVGARRAGGTGLGLALSQEFARAMGGRIAVDSTPAVGSVFTLELPLGDLTGVPLAGNAPLNRVDDVDEDPAELFTGARVLVVEDNAVNQLLVQKLLERLGVVSECEGDGLLALNRLQAADKPYDLVLLDMQLPSLDGYGIARRLRTGGYRGFIVALTASAMAGERDRAMQAGCDDFIAKPLQTRAFLRTCRAWLRRNREG